MSDSGRGVRAELAALRAQLARPGSDGARVAEALEALLARVDRGLRELAEIRAQARAALDQARGEAMGAAGMGVSAPVPQLRADRLGASTFVEKGWHLITTGDAAGAVEGLRRALELAPGDVQATALLGWAEMLRGRLDEAMAILQQVLAREPDHALARVNLGFICLRQRSYGDAISHLSRVIREATDRRAVLYGHYYLGLVYLAREMYEDAVTFLERAVELGPNLGEARYELGRAYWLAGMAAEARAEWGVGATGRFSPWAGRCEEALAEVARGEVPRSALS